MSLAILLDTIKDLAVGLFTTWLAPRAAKMLRTLPALRHSIYLHKRELREKLNVMPFLYKDLSGEILADFVDIDIETLDTSTLERREARKIDITSEERLRQKRKALLLGSAGIGKTTFMRHTILHSLKAKALPFFYPKESFIPIYVPLKAVDNMAPSPVLRYILSSVAFLQIGGLPRLVDLMEQRQVMLFLDGYDEIPFTPSGEDSENYVQQELALIMDVPRRESTLPHIKPNHEPFYNASRSCRIWLSSRQEFFEQNTILPSDLARQGPSPDLIALRIEGIGNNRAILAKTIFDKYRRRSSVYRDLLSEEYFMQEIDSFEELELKELSFNPLFLTVMCYTYVQRALAANSYAVTIAENRVGLILECITLLLFDLDYRKAGDVPEAERAGLLRRRNEFKEEKLEFLKYLAARLFLHQKTVFDYSYLKLSAVEMFSGRNDTASRKIMRELTTVSLGRPNFAEQLIYSGVFVIVDRSRSNGTLFDFPHRQFREVLAAAYFAQPENVSSLIEHIELKSLSELIILFFDQSTFQEVILEALLDAATRHKEDPYFGLLTVKCLQKKPNYPAGPVVRRFFVEAIKNNSLFTAPEDLSQFFQADEQFISFLSSSFKTSVAERKTNSLSVCCDLLFRYNKLLLIELLRSFFQSPSPYSELAPQLMYHALKAEARIIADNFQWIGNDSGWFSAFYFTCATECYDLVEQDHHVTTVIRSLTLPRFTLLLYALWKFRWQDQSLEPPTSLHEHSDVAFSAIRNFPPNSPNRPDRNRDKDYCYIIGDNVLRALNLEARKKLRLMKYNVFWTRDSLEKRLESLRSEESAKIGREESQAIVKLSQFESVIFFDIINCLIDLDFTLPKFIKVFDDTTDGSPSLRLPSGRRGKPKNLVSKKAAR